MLRPPNTSDSKTNFQSELVFKISLCVLLWLNTGKAYSTTTTTDRQLWFTLIHQGRISNHWGYWFGFQHRTHNNFDNNLYVDLAGLGATYWVNDNLRISAGYAYGLLFPSVSSPKFFIDEHRPWQLVSYSYGHKRLHLMQILLCYQRFIRNTTGEHLKPGYTLRQALSYNMILCIAFNNKHYQKGCFGAALNEEILANVYSADHVSHFDQNRAFAGLFYQLSNNTQLQLGYLNVTASTAKGYSIVHAISLAVFQKIDWRKR